MKTTPSKHAKHSVAALVDGAVWFVVVIGPIPFDPGSGVFHHLRGHFFLTPVL
jgi:hypothetical protein